MTRLPIPYSLSGLIPSYSHPIPGPRRRRCPVRRPRSLPEPGRRLLHVSRRRTQRLADVLDTEDAYGRRLPGEDTCLSDCAVMC